MTTTRSSSGMTNKFWPPQSMPPTQRRVLRPGGAIADIPMVAVTAGLTDCDDWRRDPLHPIRRYDRLAIPHAAGLHELADLDEITRQQPQARGGVRLAILSLGPFGRSELQRIEQHAAAVVEQRLAGAPGDQ